MIYNKNHIVTIQSFDEVIDLEYIYLPEKKGILGYGYSPAGIYIHGNRDEIYSVNAIPINRVKRDNAIYHKPRIVIFYTNNITETVYFNSIQERELYLKKEFNEQNWRREIS